ncbi:hypothetical protein K435DRAFT_473423 [Dendrothele bispora CBS 962.96]|uniref:Uncharacterized protein n=1 Tax=Dendrothele bispora (strain CBS 962.96) TaxID=1314807 RepID=A0A4V4HGS2_DENBC|nr:hypothetical protein K435DRAFT_473423 [Dendrothele bispora CBS 962.96]
MELLDGVSILHSRIDCFVDMRSWRRVYYTEYYAAKLHSDVSILTPSCGSCLVLPVNNNPVLSRCLRLGQAGLLHRILRYQVPFQCLKTQTLLSICVSAIASSRTCTLDFSNTYQRFTEWMNP